MSATGGRGETRLQEPTATERATARRAAESRATVPQVELSGRVDMEQCLYLRERERCSITAILTRACALALKEVPRANGAYRDGRFELYSRINVGVVMETDDDQLIPTVFDAGEKSLRDLTDEIDALRARLRDRQLTSAAFAGATFTLANVGADGVASSTIVTTPPQAAALAAGAIREVPVVRQGVVVPGRVMAATLACDHRILYGREAARFLNTISSALESGDL